MRLKNLKADNVIVQGDLEVNSDLKVHGDLYVDRDIYVAGTTTTTHLEYVIKETAVDKLICSKCKGTKFYPTSNVMIYTVYIENGIAPRRQEYRCSNCGNLESVEYPAVYFEKEAQEIELPKKEVK